MTNLTFYDLPPPVIFTHDETLHSIPLPPLAEFLTDISTSEHILKLHDILDRFRTPKSYHRVDVRLVESSELPPKSPQHITKHLPPVVNGDGGTGLTNGDESVEKEKKWRDRGGPIILPKGVSREEYLLGPATELLPPLNDTQDQSQSNGHLTNGEDDDANGGLHTVPPDMETSEFKAAEAVTRKASPSGQDKGIPPLPPSGPTRRIRELRLDLKTLDAAALFALETWRREVMGLEKLTLDHPDSIWYDEEELELESLSPPSPTARDSASRSKSLSHPFKAKTKRGIGRPRKSVPEPIIADSETQPIQDGDGSIMDPDQPEVTDKAEEQMNADDGETEVMEPISSTALDVSGDLEEAISNAEIEDEGKGEDYPNLFAALDQQGLIRKDDEDDEKENTLPEEALIQALGAIAAQSETEEKPEETLEQIKELEGPVSAPAPAPETHAEPIPEFVEPEGESEIGTQSPFKSASGVVLSRTPSPDVILVDGFDARQENDPDFIPKIPSVRKAKFKEVVQDITTNEAQALFDDFGIIASPSKLPSSSSIESPKKTNGKGRMRMTIDCVEIPFKPARRKKKRRIELSVSPEKNSNLHGSVNPELDGLDISSIKKKKNLDAFMGTKKQDTAIYVVDDEEMPEIVEVVETVEAVDDEWGILRGI